MSSHCTQAMIAVALSMGIAGGSPAQCPHDWVKTDGFPGAGVTPQVWAVTSWDPDGAGPAAARLVAGGSFQYMGDCVADGIAMLNADTGKWEAFGGNVVFNTQVKDESIDEGAVLSLTVFEGNLIVGGIVQEIGGTPVNSIARFDGKSWSPLGSGLNGLVLSMTEYNGELIAAGNFITTGNGTVVNRIARWNPLTASWQPLAPPGGPAGMNSTVQQVAVYNGELIATGHFTSAGGVSANRIARWNGSQWQPLGTGLNSAGFALTVLNNDLYAGGNFTLAGGVPNSRGVARWDGANWHAVGGGPLNGVNSLVAYHGDIIASGVFIFNSGSPNQSIHVARFNTQTQAWEGMQGGFQNGANPSQLIVHSDQVVAAGPFRWAGNRSAYGLAGWSDATQSWNRFAPGFDWTPFKFTTYEGDLIAGGSFDSAGDADAKGVARWDGSAWHALGAGVGHLHNTTVNALQVYNDSLYVGGIFYFAGGSMPVFNIAAWNGDTETWSDVGGGVTGCTEVPRVNAMAVYNGELIVGGWFCLAGGVPANNIASWNGKEWKALANGLPSIIHSMIVFNDELIVSTVSVGMQRWNGSVWQPLPGGPASSAMTIYNGQLLAGAWDPFVWNGTTWTMLPGWSWDPNGAGVGNYAYAVYEGDLIVAGQFENAAGIPAADGLARFDGTSWHAMNTPNGATASITSALFVHNGELITNGRIVHSDGTMSNWRRMAPVCPPGPPGDLNGDGIVNVDDLVILLGSWGACAPIGSCVADIAPQPGNGTVDVDDLVVLLGNWG